MACKDGEAVVKLLYLSADPYMRGRMKESNASYRAAFRVDEAISGYVVAEVLISRSPSVAVGDVYSAFLPYVTIQVIDIGATRMWKVPASVPKEHYSYGIGALGMPGLTAYFGLLEILHPIAGQSARQARWALW